MKATEQDFPLVLFIMLCKVVLTFESVNEILKCDHSNESYWVVLSCGTVYYAVQGGSNFWVCGWIPVGCDLSNESYQAVLSCNYAYCVTIILIFFCLEVCSFLFWVKPAFLPKWSLGRSKSQNWPAGSFWKWNRPFKSLRFKTHQSHAYYNLGFDWYGSIVLVKVKFSLRREWTGRPVLTNGKHLRLSLC